MTSSRWQRVRATPSCWPIPSPPSGASRSKWTGGGWTWPIAEHRSAPRSWPRTPPRRPARSPASVYVGQVGQQVASPLVTLVDDGTVGGEWGNYAVDDEGKSAAHNRSEEHT